MATDIGTPSVEWKPGDEFDPTETATVQLNPVTTILTFADLRRNNEKLPQAQLSAHIKWHNYDRSERQAIVLTNHETRWLYLALKESYGD